MKTLILDSTTPGSLFLGIIAGSCHYCQERLLPDHGFETLLLAVDHFLRQQKIAPQSIRRCVVVNGPGRFSGLRIVAVIANMLAWDTGARLAVVRRSTIAFASAGERLASYQKKARFVPMVKPYYGQPPSITKTKKRQ